MQKLTFFLVTAGSAIVLYIGLGSFSAVTSELVSGNPQSGVPAAPDYLGVSTGIDTVLFDGEGAIHYTLQAERQVHYADSTSSLERPVIRLFRQGGSDWNIIADSGRLLPQQQDSTVANIELRGAVEVYSVDGHGNRTVLSTEYLAINTEARTLQTDFAVAMKTTNIEQTAVGLYADLNTEEIHLLQDAAGRYDQSIEL